MNIKDWIQGIGKADPAKDLLSTFDESVDGSIGGLGITMEKMYNSQRSAPLIGFRDLEYKKITEIEQFMKDVDLAIQKLHRDFADAPTKMKRDIRGCTEPFKVYQSAAESATPTQLSSPVVTSVVVTPVIVTPIDPPAQPSCVSNPIGSVKNAHEGELRHAVKHFFNKNATEINATPSIKNEAAIIAGARQEGRVEVNVAYDYPESLGNQDDVYDFSLTFEWLQSCLAGGWQQLRGYFAWLVERLWVYFPSIGPFRSWADA